MSVLSGDTATAGKSGLSPAAAALTGALQCTPLSSDHWTRARSFEPPLWSVGVGPLHHVMTIRFRAPAPVGAPLPMSTLGKLSVRAPATPAKLSRPDAVSN